MNAGSTWEAATASNMPPADTEPCWAGSPTSTTRAPAAAALPHSAAKSLVLSWPASSTITHPPSGIDSPDELMSATVLDAVPSAAPRVPAATAVGAAAMIRSCPTAAAMLDKAVVFPDPAGPISTLPVVAVAISPFAAWAWSSPSPPTSMRSTAAPSTGAGDASQAAVACSAATRPGDHQRPSCRTRRRSSRSRSALAVAAAISSPARPTAAQPGPALTAAYTTASKSTSDKLVAESSAAAISRSIMSPSKASCGPFATTSGRS
ncbi:MAG: hypothetical protein OXT07_15485 [bacterium]|nr:hypothetical protein [bacterium]